MYTKKVLEHFKNPHNQGEMKDPDSVGIVGNPVCGDVMKIYLKVKDNVIKDISFETLGCAAAIAVSSVLTDIARGKTLSRAVKITREEIVKNLGDLPAPKKHCSMLGIEALKKAISEYKPKIKK